MQAESAEFVRLRNDIYAAEAFHARKFHVEPHTDPFDWVDARLPDKSSLDDDDDDGDNNRSTRP